MDLRNKVKATPAISIALLGARHSILQHDLTFTFVPLVSLLPVNTLL